MKSTPPGKETRVLSLGIRTVATIVLAAVSASFLVTMTSFAGDIDRHTTAFDVEKSASAQVSKTRSRNAAGACDAHFVQSHIGSLLIQDRVPDTIDADDVILERDLPAPYRILGPDTMRTMDFVANRLNVQIDEQGRIMTVSCG